MFLLCLLQNLTNISHINLRWPPFFLLNIIFLVKQEQNIAIIKIRPRSTTDGLSQLILSRETDRQTERHTYNNILKAT